MPQSPLKPGQDVTSLMSGADVTALMAPSQSVPNPSSLGSQLVQTGMNTIGEAASTVVSPVVHPLDFLSSIVRMPGQIIQSHMDQGQKAWDAFQRGDRSEAVLREIAAIIPIAGPILANYVDADQSGKEQIAGGGIGAMVLGKVPGAIAGRPIVPALRRGMNPTDARAIDAARSAGVPVNAGVATGNRAVQGMIQGAEKTTATGAGFVNRARFVTEQNLEGMGQDLAGQVNARGPASGAQGPTAPGVRLTVSEATQRSADTLRRTVAAEGATADQAYSVFRQASDSGAVPPASFAVIRAALQPIYDRLVGLRVSTGGLDASSIVGQTKAVLDKIMNAQTKPGNTVGALVKDVPLADAESVLGYVKEALRNEMAKKQLGQSSGQLQAIVRVLQKEIDTKAGTNPDVLAALKDGRAAVARQHNALDVLQTVEGKTGLKASQTSGQELLNPAGAKKLQRLAAQSPESVKELGRGWFEDQFAAAKEKPGFSLQKSAGDWRAMSLDTKRIVFKDAIARDPLYLQRVDDFFRAATKIQENLNPSGTAAAGANLFKLFTALPEAVLGGSFGMKAAALTVGQDVSAALFARAMNNPRVVQLMVDGFKIPASQPARVAANVAAIEAIIKAELAPQATSAGAAGMAGGSGRQGGPGTTLAQAGVRR